MRILASILLGAVLLSVGWTPDASAQSCEARAEGSVPDYAPGTRNPIICDTHGAQHVTIVDQDGTATPITTTTTYGTNTAAAPSLAEASAGAFSWDLAGNLRVTQGTLEAGEDLTNNLVMTSGGAVRQTTITSGVTTNTTSAAVLVPTGVKSFYGQVVGTGSITQTQALYCDIDNDAANGVLLATLTLSGTTRDQALTPPIEIPCAYMYVTSTLTTGTSATGAVYANY